MNAFATFVVRLVGYALALGIVARIAQALWVQRGLDGIAAVASLHAIGLTLLAVAPIVLALIGAGRLRYLAVFLAAFLAGAVVTAPFALARLAG
jgi:hypothetical protein